MTFLDFGRSSIAVPEGPKPNRMALRGVGFSLSLRSGPYWTPLVLLHTGYNSITGAQIFRFHRSGLLNRSVHAGVKIKSRGHPH